eukprot:111724_1
MFKHLWLLFLLRYISCISAETYTFADKYDIFSNKTNINIGSVKINSVFEISFDYISDRKCAYYCHLLNIGDVFQIFVETYTNIDPDNYTYNTSNLWVMYHDTSWWHVLVYIDNIYDLLPNITDGKYHNIYILMQFDDNEYTFKYDELTYTNERADIIMNISPYPIDWIRQPKINSDKLYPVFVSPFINTSICLLPPVIGFCKSNKPRYYHNATSQTCILFFWGGCGGNDNRFVTQEECQNVCGNVQNYTHPPQHYITNMVIRTALAPVFTDSLMNHINDNGEWSKYNVMWIHATWHEAQTYCQSKFGTDLAVIHSKEDWLEIYALLSTIQLVYFEHNTLTYVPLWIGLNKFNDNWTWIDKAQYDVIPTNHTKYLYDDEEYNARIPFSWDYYYNIKSSEKCAFIDIDMSPDPMSDKVSYYVYSEQCAKRMGFICQTVGNFAVIPQPATWNEADKYCQDEYNSSLYSWNNISDADLIEVAYTVLIAFQLQLSTTKITIYDNTPHLAMGWVDYDNSTTCTAIENETELPVTADCNNKRPFVCKKNGKYPRNYLKPKCEFKHCWKQLISSGEYSVEFLGSSPPIGYYNNKLYIFNNYMQTYGFCYTELDSENNNILQLANDISLDLHCQSYKYDIINDVLDKYAQTFPNISYYNYAFLFPLSAHLSIACYHNGCIQNENMLYMFGQIDTGSWIVDISKSTSNHQEFQFKSISSLFVILSADLLYSKTELPDFKIHEYRYHSQVNDKVTDSCLATNSTHLFLVTDQIWIYNINKALAENINNKFITRDDETFGLWSVLNQTIPYNLKGSSCSMNWRNNFLYIFSGWNEDASAISDQIWKYDTINQHLFLLNVSYPKPNYISKAILAQNGMIYFFDGISDYATGQYPIFDSKTEMFINNELTSTQLPHTIVMNFYTAAPKSWSNAVVYDHNAIMMLYTTDYFSENVHVADGYSSIHMDNMLNFEYLITTNISFSFPDYILIKNTKHWDIRNTVNFLDLPDIASRSYLILLKSLSSHSDIERILNITINNAGEEECNIYEMD